MNHQPCLCHIGATIAKRCCVLYKDSCLSSEAKQMCTEVNSSLNTIEKIIAKIRQNEAIRSKANEALKLPVQTRWLSYYSMVVALKKRTIYWSRSEKTFFGVRSSGNRQIEPYQCLYQEDRINEVRLLTQLISLEFPCRAECARLLKVVKTQLRKRSTATWHFIRLEKSAEFWRNNESIFRILLHWLVIFSPFLPSSPYERAFKELRCIMVDFTRNQMSAAKNRVSNPYQNFFFEQYLI
uniref:Uncharacterized protein n=1 Tax=Ditylenchus dipsaci TaxID=166011 RepID=A0A915DVC6_9BILA